MKHPVTHHIVWLLLLVHPLCMYGQLFSLDVRNDSLSYLVLRSGGDKDCLLSRWCLPYPTYGFCTGDVDGDGSVDAIVGVVKPTRFDPVPARRLFVFKQVEGHIRPLWLGSKLGGTIHDFRFTNGCVRCLHSSDSTRYHVVDYRWGSFGPADAHIIVTDVSYEEARNAFDY